MGEGQTESRLEEERDGERDRLLALNFVSCFLNPVEIVKLSFLCKGAEEFLTACSPLVKLDVRDLDFLQPSPEKLQGRSVRDFLIFNLCESRLTKKGTCIEAVICTFGKPQVQKSCLLSLPSGLSELELNGCQELDDSALLFLASRLKKLVRFELYWNLKVTDAGVVKILRSNFRTLRHLNLSGCRKLTDTTAHEIADYCSRLRFLDLTRPAGMTEKGLWHICERLSNLETLTLYASNNFTPEAFQFLSRLRLLKNLDLCGSSVEDEVVENAAGGGGWLNLVSLNLTWCLRVTDRSLKALSKGCPALETLSLHGNTSITPDGLTALEQSPLKDTLTALDVRGCRQLDAYVSEGFKRLKEAFPKLTCFELHS
uniref:F-box/LRR-repeat protein 15-like leucin rich repeat domain-containing protein n=1 Tax=Chromera velia CCMP2878 TaxID=1169474 RepID=A0A0G4H8H3_9ALVE|eukprot:Cvel_25108.t1-p1 / transcript=Cvel_25108.t1 / gene=Cvel_25108 / organism=Chromera_velia_CCMP2878 / gene_product=F-box protein At3g58530, putative / transcript_product=F-box protein At3g58530, putative / location=Cvel_scaffold2801:17469-20802(-) / protein_length=370 / sequence_SO=supercontig / SO=protein_coding / is_pseudo=false